jgi:hypothetical protein
MNKVLAITASAEAATGAALLAVPSLVSEMLLGAEVAGLGVAVARVAGMGILSLGIACWPGRLPSRMPLAGMVTYGVLITAYLAYLGISGDWVGPLLWPAVGLHAILTILLARALVATGPVLPLDKNGASAR